MKEEGNTFQIGLSNVISVTIYHALSGRERRSWGAWACTPRPVSNPRKAAGNNCIANSITPDVAVQTVEGRPYTNAKLNVCISIST